MFEITGVLLRTFERPGFKPKDGERRPDRPMIALQTETILRNGELEPGIQKFEVESVETFEPYVGRTIRLPVGIFARGSDLVVYAPKGARPQLAEPVPSSQAA